MLARPPRLLLLPSLPSVGESDHAAERLACVESRLGWQNRDLQERVFLFCLHAAEYTATLAALQHTLCLLSSPSFGDPSQTRRMIT